MLQQVYHGAYGGDVKSVRAELQADEAVWFRRYR
jgi:hypothetical protein